MRKILVFFLSVSLMMSMFSTTAFAEEIQNANIESPVAEKAVSYEAMIGETSYPTLKEALLVGGEIKLLKDVSVNEIITIEKDTILDLGDFTITNNSPKRPFVVKANSFTIKANHGGMVIPESNTASYGFVEAYVNNFSILGGNYKGNTDNGRLFRINIPESKTGTLNVDGIVVNTNNEIIGHKDTFKTFSGTITNSELYTQTRAMYFDILDTTDASTLTISNVKSVVDRGPVLEVAGGNTVLANNDWKVTGNYQGGYSWARAAVGVAFAANVNIKSGSYIADSKSMEANEGYGVYIYTSGGNVNIEGGNFAGTTASLRADVDKDTYNTPADITVNGGEFTGDLLAKTNSGMENIKINAGNFNNLTDATLLNNNNITIDGGVFDLDITDKVSEGKENISVTKNNDKKFYIGKENVNTALNNVTTGDTVNIIQNVTDVKLPDGVKVENNTGADITVNGDVLKENGSITVDETPTATVTYSNNGDWTNEDVTVTVNASEAIKGITGWTKVNETTFTKVFTDNALEILTITDMTNNSIKVRVDVRNIDKNAPEIRGVEDVALTQGDEFDPLEGIFAYDNECGELKDVKVTPSSVDTDILGIYELEYTVSDLAGNITTIKRIVKVNPQTATLNHAPIITAKDVTLYVGDTFEPLKNVVVKDQEDGENVKLEVIKNTVDTTKAGTYEVVYKAADSDGATSTKTIKVTVKAKTTIAPNIDTPETGDQTSLGMFACLLAVSSLSIAMLAILNRKRSTEK